MSAARKAAQQAEAQKAYQAYEAAMTAFVEQMSALAVRQSGPLLRAMVEFNDEAERIINRRLGPGPDRPAVQG